MDRKEGIAAINQVVVECMLLENDLSTLRLMGGLGGGPLREAEARYLAAAKRMQDVFRASGVRYDEIDTLTDENGVSPWDYGVAEFLKREYGRY